MPTSVLIYSHVASSETKHKMSSCKSFSVPNQPTDYNFPKREFGKSKITYRSFQGQWFKQWKWLHYDNVRDVAYRHNCVSAVNSGKM